MVGNGGAMLTGQKWRIVFIEPSPPRPNSANGVGTVQDERPILRYPGLSPCHLGGVGQRTAMRPLAQYRIELSAVSSKAS